MTSHPTSISSKWHHNISTTYAMTNKSSYLSCQCQHVIFIPAIHKSSKKAEYCTLVFKQPHSKSATVSYILPQKNYSGSCFDQKPPNMKHYKCSTLPLILVVNRSIYYLLNGSFNQAYDVNHLIN